MKKPPKKTRADAKLKNLSQEEQEQLWQYINTPLVEGEARRMPTLEEAQVQVPLMFGFTVSTGSLSEWRAWYSLNLRMENAAERANQTALRLAKDSDLTPEDIERVAQTVFTAETLQGGDVEGYVKLAKLRLAASKQAIEREKISAAAKTKIEAGLDALFAEIQGNPKALKLFTELKEVVNKA